MRYYVKLKPATSPTGTWKRGKREWEGGIEHSMFEEDAIHFIEHSLVEDSDHPAFLAIIAKRRPVARDENTEEEPEVKHPRGKRK